MAFAEEERPRLRARYLANIDVQLCVMRTLDFRAFDATGSSKLKQEQPPCCPTGQRQDINPREFKKARGKSLLKAGVSDAHSPRTCKG